MSKLSELQERLTTFIDDFQEVFIETWDDTREGIASDLIRPDLDFLRPPDPVDPDADDEMDNWEALRESYWRLIRTMRDLHIPTTEAGAEPPTPPFRPDPLWLTPTVLAIARQMDETCEFSAMPILADALQDAGCDDNRLLDHCRQPGDHVHVRGCWVLDFLLDKIGGGSRATAPELT